jgi:sulfate permease, SulP family
VTDFVNAFNFKEDIKSVEIVLSNAHVWDEPGVSAGVKTDIIGLNVASKSLVDSVAVFNKVVKSLFHIN